MTRQPFHVAAWILLMAAFSVAIFDQYVLGGMLLVASVASAVAAWRIDRAGSDNRHAPELPPP
jgi:hypothetical protein